MESAGEEYVEHSDIMDNDLYHQIFLELYLCILPECGIG